MPADWNFGSAVTVRLGIVAGAALGGLAGHWFGAMSTPAGGATSAWPAAAGAAGGLAVAWAALEWLARRHRGTGVIVGGALAVAAAVALLAWLA
jgi:hypothetical protein